MYHYPIDSLDYFATPLKIHPDNHTMGASLQQYMEMKIHPLINECGYTRIVVQGKFDRTYGISDKEKSGKLFNYIRPTAKIENSVLYLNCFPGFDYIFHYGNIVKSYISLIDREVDVTHILPSEKDCWEMISKSELKAIPKVDTIIMGYVEGLEGISGERVWHGTGNFLWKKVYLASGQGILLGCKHTYWGEIAGRIVKVLGENGAKRIIYSGKLGTLNPNLAPNQIVATGNTSILPNGKVISWNNLFGGITDFQVASGIHITVPSVLQETKIWHNKNKDHVDFVDPEIGHMALAAYESGIEFSYFHIISDNLSRKFEVDLSNERRLDVIEHRKKLCRKIGAIIKQL